MMHTVINRLSRRSVRWRSGGRCEICGKHEAVHMHHVIYKNAGREDPGDLKHICLLCHIDQHPEKAEQMARFEVRRQLKRWIDGTKKARGEYMPKTDKMPSIQEILAAIHEDLSVSTVARWLLMRAGLL